MKPPRLWRRRAVLLAAGFSLAPNLAIAQTAYPTRPVKIIAPVAAGTVADLVPRIVAEKLAARWGQPVVVEDRPGAANNLGAEAAARAEPDGYTLLAAPPTALVVNQGLYKNLPFDPDAFVPITVLAEQPNVLVANPQLPVANLREFIADAKANPEKLSFGSSGVGTSAHLGMELLQAKTGIRLLHVPYKGLAPALQDVLAGRIDVMLDNLGTSALHIKNGELKGLGVGTEKRTPLLSELPAIAKDVPGFVSTTWFALVAPPNTPSPIVSKVYDAVSDILTQPDVREHLGNLYATPVGGRPAATAAFFANQRSHWRSIIVSAGIKAE